MKGGLTWQPLITAATVLGIGMGGALDGIFLHEIFQFHHLVSHRIAPRESLQNAEINMFWDGVFQLGCWTTTMVGLGLLWRVILRADAARSTRVFVGGLLFGWGIFNLVEGILNHHILHLHHVIEQPGHLPFDLAFLASGVVLAVAGLLTIRAGRRQPA